MSVFLTADVQLHNHSSFGSLLPSGFSNRLQDGIDALDQILAGAKVGDTIIVLGDVFETQRAVDTSVMYAFSGWVERVVSKKVSLVLVAGNHDHYSRSGSIHALRPFELHPGVTVISDHDTLLLDKNEFVFFAYTDDTDALKGRINAVAARPVSKHARGRFLCIHQGVSGALLASSVFEGTLGLEDLHQDKFDHVFLGHFHKPQSLSDSVTYLGSPYQVTSEEAGDVKRFIKIDSEGQITSVLTEGNCFHRVSFEGLETAINLPRGYYKVHCSSNHQVDKVAGIARRLGIQFKVVFDRVEHTPTHTNVKTLNWEDAVSNWLSSRGRPDLIPIAIERLHISLTPELS